MNELDRRTIQEKLTLTNVTRATHSGWFTVQNEYVVTAGSPASGTYAETQAVDGNFEAFREEPVLANPPLNPPAYASLGLAAYSSGPIANLVSDDEFKYKTAATGPNRLTISNVFSVDQSALPLSNIQGIEIALRYNVSQNGEKWFLKAYNWKASDFSDSGFNDTAGNLPLLGQWNDYAVNVTSNWRDYMSSNGTVLIELRDEGLNTTQTMIQIDFFGVNEVIDGTRFDLHNSGPLTTHVVATWIVNSTYHDRRDVDIFVNPAADASVTVADLAFPQGNFTVKATTEMGNEAVFP